MTIAALVLAGGQSRRMGGGDKTLLMLGGQTMLARILARLAAEHSLIAISANGDPARFGVPCPILPDAVAGQGPLAGVLAGLQWAAASGADALLSVPGDTPLIPSGLAASLSPAPAVAETGGQRHHLVALWPVSAAKPLQDWLASGKPGRVRSFAETIGMRPVAFTGNPFLNANTPDDVATLATVLNAGTSCASIPS
jgi:molybdopterin-guanine dinucleotide biosynthesis protein A